MEEIINLDSAEKHAEMFGLECMHPLINIVDMSKATHHPGDVRIRYGVYALFLKLGLCGKILYGRGIYDYKYGTVTSFAPGQVIGISGSTEGPKKCYGIIFHPDIIKGTPLAREMASYSFFSYSSNEALHLSEEERTIFFDCLEKIKMELSRPVDGFSKKLISKNIELLLDYCMRFYSRQFDSRKPVNSDILTRFEHLLNSYFDDGNPQRNGLPTVQYFADKICLSPNYFGDLIRRETGCTAQEHIQNKITSMANDLLLDQSLSVTQVAERLGFNYSQHFNRFFKKQTGLTPTEYRNKP